MLTPIDFIETPFHALSPLSPHQIEIWGERFATLEHAYQASRIKPGLERDAIVAARSPMDAWREGQKHKKNATLAVKPFDKVAIMEELFRAKLAQHADVREVLQASGNRELRKNAPDAFWGIGDDGKGQNVMGKMWMRLREERH